MVVFDTVDIASCNPINRVGAVNHGQTLQRKSHQKAPVLDLIKTRCTCYRLHVTSLITEWTSSMPSFIYHPFTDAFKK